MTDTTEPEIPEESPLREESPSMLDPDRPPKRKRKLPAKMRRESYVKNWKGMTMLLSASLHLNASDLLSTVVTVIARNYSVIL